MRLTEKNNSPYSTDIYDVKINEYDCKNCSTDTSLSACLDKLGHLEDMEEELEVDLIPFLKEMNHLMKTSSQTTGYTTSGKEITTDYGYVNDFLQQLKGALE